MSNFMSTGWRCPSKEETTIMKRMESKRFLRKNKNFFFYSSLIIIIIYLATFASFSYKDGNSNENTYTLLFLTATLIITITIFAIIYLVLYRHFYGKKQNIEEINSNVTFLYHEMINGINDEEKLYAIVIKVDNEQLELLVDKKDYETINENTKLFLGRYKTETKYNYKIYY